MTVYRNALVIILLLLLPVLGITQELKIGFVDTIQLMKDSPQAEVARKKLETEFQPRDLAIVDMQKQEKQLEDQLTSDTGGLIDTERKKIERNLQSLKRDIKRAKEEIIEDYNVRRNEEINKLQKLIDKITVDIAKEEHFDVILRDNVLYSSKRANITDKVLERLRAPQKFDKSSAETPSSYIPGK
ncbi:MAG: OmpH family outer membrane protein [Gammaproteobacteria bacterium]|nr:OmpH family outer membrane protein [Gammaproteobacteria bacterium]